MALSSCRRSRATGFPGYALIATAGDNSLTTVDLNTFHLSGKADLKRPPSSVLTDAERAYVLTPSDGTVHIFDPEQLGQPASLRLASEISLIGLTPTRGQVAAASAAGRELVVADGLARKVSRRVKLASAPFDLDVRLHQESQKVYAAVSGGSGGIIEVVDLASGAARKRELGGELGGIRFRDDGRIIIVARYRDQALVVLDTETLQTICELPVPMRPENLAFTVDQGQLFVSGAGMDGISIVYVYDTLEVEQTMLAGRAPGAMACSQTPRYLFVASRAGSEISILSVETRKLIALTQAGAKPSHIEITRDQQYALVLNEGSGDLAVIRIPSIKANRNKSGASLFAMIPIGQNPVDLAIYNQRA